MHNIQVYLSIRMTTFLTALTLQPSDLYKKSLATTSTFQIILPHLLSPQSTDITICYPAAPSISLLSTMTLTSAAADSKPPVTPIAVYILSKRIWKPLAKMTMKSSRRRTRRCLQIKNLCLRYQRCCSSSTQRPLSNQSDRYAQQPADCTI